MRPRNGSEKLYYEYVLLKIGQNLRFARTALGLTQCEVSARIVEASDGAATMCASYYRSVECGKREVSLCRALLLADVLGLTPAQLFHGVPSAAQLRECAWLDACTAVQAAQLRDTPR